MRGHEALLDRRWGDAVAAFSEALDAAPSSPVLHGRRAGAQQVARSALVCADGLNNTWVSVSDQAEGTVWVVCLSRAQRRC